MYKQSLEYFCDIMENGAFGLQRSKRSIFHNIFKCVVFQRRQKALLWSKGLQQMICDFLYKNVMSTLDPSAENKESMTEALVAEGLVDLRKMGLGAPNE